MPVRATSVPLALSVMHPEDQADNVVGFSSRPVRAVIGVSGGGKSGSLGISLRISRRPGVPLPQSPSTISWIFRRRTPRGCWTLRGGDDGGTGHYRVDPDGPVLPPAQPRRIHLADLLERSDAVGAMKRLVSERLRLEIAPHPAVSAVKDPGVFDADPAGFSVPIGLALLGEEADRVNLLPAEYLGRRERWKTLVAVGVIAAIFLAANPFSTLGCITRKPGTGKCWLPCPWDEPEPVRPGGVPALADLRRVAREASAGEQAANAFYPVERIFRAARRAGARDDDVFESGSYREDGGFRAELEGKVHGETLTVVQDQLNMFLASVRKGGGCRRWRMSRLTSGRGRKRTGRWGTSRSSSCCSG